MHERTELSIERSDQDEVSLLRLDGEIDLSSAPRLRAEVRRLVDGGRHELVLDFSTLSYMDSSGLAALLDGRRRAKEAGGRLSVVCPGNAVVHRLFAVTGLLDALPVHASLEEALAAGSPDASA